MAAIPAPAPLPALHYTEEIRSKSHSSVAMSTAYGSSCDSLVTLSADEEDEGDVDSEQVEESSPSSKAGDHDKGEGQLRRIGRSYDFRELCDLEDVM